MESSTAEFTGPALTGSHIRAYLAGSGATVALVAGAVVAFLAVATFVAFHGLPTGSDNDSTAQVNLTASAPAAAAAAAAPATGAVAAAPATPGPAATTEIIASLPPTQAPPAAPGVDPNIPTPPGFIGDPTVVVPGGGTSSPGTVGNVIQNLDNTTSGLGLNLGLGNATNGVTQQVDNTVRGTLNNAGGLLGNPHLGDQTTDALNNLTNGLIGQGGLTDHLLGK